MLRVRVAESELLRDALRLLVLKIVWLSLRLFDPVELYVSETLKLELRILVVLKVLVPEREMLAESVTVELSGFVAV